MIIGIAIFFIAIGIFEYIQYQRRCSREKKAIYLTVKGRIIEYEIYNFFVTKDDKIMIEKG